MLDSVNERLSAALAWCGNHQPQPSPKSEQQRQMVSERLKHRRKTEPDFKIMQVLRTRLAAALRGKGIAKAGRTVWMLGCTVPELREHLQRQFKPDMTWENHGQLWEIDHIRPVCTFNLRERWQQRECFHHSNLQPLYKTENRQKGSDKRGQQMRKGRKWKEVMAMPKRIGEVVTE